MTGDEAARFVAQMIEEWPGLAPLWSHKPPRAARTRAGLTQRQVRERSGVDRSLVRALERGDVPAKDHMVAVNRLSAVCGLSVSWLHLGPAIPKDLAAGPDCLPEGRS